MKTLTENDQEFICDINTPCFHLLTPEESAFVRSSKTQLLFRKGDTLTKQGAFASYALFVINGIARQYIEGEGGRTHNLRIIQPGEFIGLSAVFSDPTFNYSSTALTDCQVFLIEKETIAKISQQNGSFAFLIIKRYCQQNAYLYTTLNKSVFKQMNGRLAETLIYLDSIRPTHPMIFQLLTRKDIADFAGISMESAVKLLKTFEKDGIITLNEKDVHIINKESLEEISRRG